MQRGVWLGGCVCRLPGQLSRDSNRQRWLHSFMRLSSKMTALLHEESLDTDRVQETKIAVLSAQRTEIFPCISLRSSRPACASFTDINHDAFNLNWMRRTLNSSMCCSTYVVILRTAAESWTLIEKDTCTVCTRRACEGLFFVARGERRMLA